MRASGGATDTSDMTTSPASLALPARVLAVLAAAALVLGLFAPTASAAPGRVDASVERQMLDMLNAERTDRGLAPLRRSTGATGVARDWSATMQRQERLYHRPDLRAPFTGRWTRLGENLAAGGHNPQSLHDALMDSSPHRANILQRDFRWVGVGAVTTGNTLWVTFNFGAGSDQVASQYRMAASNGPFADVPDSHTFVRNIAWLANAGITKGCNPPNNTRFCPEQQVTRGQMAAFLERALNLPSGRGRFADVPARHTFREAIAALADANITNGCNPPRNDRFCPDAPVTRAQMAAFLTRALDLSGGGDRFRDVPRGSTFETVIAELAGAGITRGCNPPRNDRFCPDEPVTRGQMAAFLHRALD